MALNAVAAIPYLFLLGVAVFMVLFQFLAYCIGGGDDAHHDVDLAPGDAHDVDSDHTPGFLGKLFSIVLVGSSVPIFVVLYVLCFSCGITGLAASLALAKFFAVSDWFLLATLPFSSLASLLITRSIVRKLAPIFQISGSAESHEELVGKLGRVSSIKADHKFGEIVVPLNGVSEHIIAITDGEVIQQDDSVVVTDIDHETGRPIVTRIKN